MEPNINNTPEQKTEQKKSNGALVGAVIIIIIIIIGGLYVMLNRQKNNAQDLPIDTNTEINTTEEINVNNEDITSSVLNSLNSIETEINNMESNISLDGLE